MSTLEKRTFFTRTRLIQVMIGLPVGALTGYAVGRLAGDVQLAADWGWSDGLGVLVAGLLLLIGVVMLAVSFNRRATGAMLDPDEPRPANPQQIRLARQQGWVFLLSGVMMATPVLAASFDPPFTVRAMLVTALVASFMLQTALNLAFWQSADEIMRRMVAEVSVVSFWVLQGALFLWAAAEKLGLVPPLTTWDCLTVLMVFYLAVSMVFGVRRGFA